MSTAYYLGFIEGELGNSPLRSKNPYPKMSLEWKNYEYGFECGYLKLAQLMRNAIKQYRVLDEGGKLDDKDI